MGPRAYNIRVHSQTFHSDRIHSSPPRPDGVTAVRCELRSPARIHESGASHTYREWQFFYFSRLAAQEAKAEPTCIARSARGRNTIAAAQGNPNPPLSSICSDPSVQTWAAKEYKRPRRDAATPARSPSSDRWTPFCFGSRTWIWVNRRLLPTQWSLKCDGLDSDSKGLLFGTGDHGAGPHLAPGALHVRALQPGAGHTELLRARRAAVLRARLPQPVLAEMRVLQRTDLGCQFPISQFCFISRIEGSSGLLKCLLRSRNAWRPSRRPGTRSTSSALSAANSSVKTASTKETASPTVAPTTLTCSRQNAAGAINPSWRTTSQHSTHSGTQTASSARFVSRLFIFPFSRSYPRYIKKVCLQCSLQASTPGQVYTRPKSSLTKFLNF